MADRSTNVHSKEALSKRIQNGRRLETPGRHEAKSEKKRSRAADYRNSRYDDVDGRVARSSFECNSSATKCDDAYIDDEKSTDEAPLGNVKSEFGMQPCHSLSDNVNFDIKDDGGTSVKTYDKITIPLLHTNSKATSGNDIDRVKTPSKRSLAKSDSLPYNRGRLSQQHKTQTSPKRRRESSRDHGEQSPLLIRRTTSSSDTSLRRKSHSPRPTESPDEQTTLRSLARSVPGLRHQLDVNESSQYVDSRFQEQNFEFIDESSDSTISEDLACSVCGRLNFPREEITFGPWTPKDIRFNVSGQYYRINPDVLAKYPDTLLGNREKRATYWDPCRNEYFLDRHRATFEVIIDYYVHDGELNRPDDIPIDIFINEIKFYCLDRENLAKFLSVEGILKVEKEKPMPDTEIKKYIWNLFEDPESCTVARIVTTMSAMVIALSIVVFCMETVPTYESLGNESLAHIKPALLTCQSHLCNETQYFEPEGVLFSAVTSTYGNTTGSCHDVERINNEEKNEKRHRRSSDLQLSPEIGAGAQYDQFDGSVVLSTMTKTLSICAQNEDVSILSKYTYLRCKSELADYVNNPQPLLDTLEELEFHDSHVDELHIENGTDANVKNTPAQNLSSTSDESESKIVKDDHVESPRNDKQRDDQKHRRHLRFNQPKKHHTKQKYNATDDFTRSKKSQKNHTIAVNRTDIYHKHGRSHRKGHKRPIHERSTQEEQLQPGNRQSLMTLKQTIKGLVQLCHKLDNRSIRSSYHWLALEATLGGAAGQLFLIESGCIVWFVIEICLRLYSCPNKKEFCTDFLNIVDAVAIMPYFITLIVTSLHTDSNLRPQTATILRTIRLVRMLRILKLSRHSRGLRILGLTLVRSTRVLVLLVCFQMVLAIIFSSIVYYVEYDAVGTKFTSIPSSFWWAIITMTTVGYGDVVPVTVLGKITGAFCAIMGILGIAFPVPVIVSNFNYLYNLDSDACKLTPEELMGNEEENDDNDRNNNVAKFQESLFDAVRKNVGSMTSGPQEGQPTGQNPAELWNYTRRQYYSGDKKSSKTTESASKQKFAKGIVAMATASVISVGLANTDALTPRKNFKSGGDKAMN